MKFKLSTGAKWFIWVACMNMALLLLMSFTVMAQTVIAKAAPGPVNFFTFITSPTFMTYMGQLILFVGLMLPAIQLILKRIPTPYSVKITGWLGWFLDILTWYQKNIIHDTTTKLTLDAGPPAKAVAETTGVTTSEPAIGTGPEKTPGS